MWMVNDLASPTSPEQVPTDTTPQPSGEFIRSARGDPGPRDWILDIYGSFVRDVGGWIAVGDLLAFLEPLGVSGASGRSALSRMKRRNEIDPVTVGRRRGYRLTDSAEQWFADGTPRIMGDQLRGADDGRWVLASFSVPEQHRSIRYRIRARLEALGFGNMAAGLLIAPGHLMDETVRALARAQLTEFVHLWMAEYAAFDHLTRVVAGAWDLDTIRAAFDDYEDIADELSASPPPSSDSEAFSKYLINVQAWRELPFMDPGIPLAYLPAGWPGDSARTRFASLASELRPAALRHFRSVVSNSQTD